MTDNDDLLPFYVAIAANPADGLNRMVFAEYLDETERSVVCGKCSGLDPGWAAHMRCCSDGYVSNGRAELAVGYRAMGACQLSSLRLSGNWYTWWSELSSSRYSGPETDQSTIPQRWIEEIALIIGLEITSRFFNGVNVDKIEWVDFPTRREAEDTCAIAFARLPETTRADILRRAGVGV